VSALATAVPADEAAGRVDADNPWPGLAAFREEDRAFFHGRETETEGLFRCVLRERLTVLFGLAGLGKTSLLHAGLFPRLRERNVLPVSIRLDHCPTARPLGLQVKLAIADAAAEAGVEAPPLDADETLWEHFHRHDAAYWSPRNRPVTPLLVFDQFEEAFTLGRRDAARTAATNAFLTELADLVEGRTPAAVKARCDVAGEEAHRYAFNHHPYKVLLSFREDFLPDVECLRPRMPSVVHNRFRILPLNGEQARRVVSESGGDLVWSDVAERVIRFVAGAEDEAADLLESLQVEPTLLSVVCRELNESRRERGLPQITLGLLTVNRDEILRDFYERSMADVSPAVRTLVEDALVTPSGFRNSMALDEALAEPGVTAAELERLVSRHLLRREYRCRVPRIELMHDVLTGVIRTSRAARHRREEEAAAETERREADARRRSEEHARRRQVELKRLRVAVATTLSLLLLTAGATWRAWEARRETAIALADLEMKEARRLAETGRTPEALGHQAHAVRLAPTSTAARGGLFALLLGRSWWLPREIVSFREQGRVVALSTDGTLAITAGDHGTLRVCDAATGQAKSAGMVHGTWVYAAAFSPDDERIATAGDDHAVRVWDWRRGEPIGAPLEHAAVVHSVRWSPDGARLVTASDDGAARVWAAATSRLVGAPLRHDAAVNTAAFSPDGLRIVTASDDRSARIWDARTGRAGGAPLLHRGAVNAAEWSRDGRTVATGSDDKTVRVWDAAAGRPLGKPFAHPGSVNAVQWTRDGTRIVTVANDQAARVWDVAAHAPVGEPLARAAWIYLAQPSADGERIVTADWDWNLVLWDVPTKPASGVALHHAGAVEHAAFEAGGERVITASQDGRARLWNARTGEAIATLPLVPPADGDVVRSPDGRLGIRLSGDDVVLWSLCTGQEQGARLRHTGTVRSARFSPDGRRLVTASDDWTARVWDAATRQPMGEPLRHDGPVVSAEFSPEGDRVVTASEDGTARVWDATSGQPIGEPLRHAGAVRSAGFAPDGQRLVTASADGTARIWDVPTGSAADARLAVRWAEAVGGYVDNAQEAPGALTVVDTLAALEGLRAGSRDGGRAVGTGAALVQWFFAPPASRGASPLAGR
jgi:WD40 repeat protein